MSPIIKTRIFVISDTHGKKVETANMPACDVAIHCGDLTDGSKLEEYRTTIDLLSQLKAPLKLVIAGNHDFTMDLPAFKKKVEEVTQDLEPELLAREYGLPGQVHKLFEEAKEEGIVLLDEGTHQFNLDNGAQLTVYASPYTPSMGQWGFQYHPNKGHKFDIGSNVDIAITHGPPKGVMDYTYGKERAGCSDLFTAIANVRPLMHCFGHIHEGWGARLVTWKEGMSQPTHFTAIDNGNSHVIENLAGLRNGKFDTSGDISEKQNKREQLEKDQCLRTSHCTGDVHAIEHGTQTLFVNAAIESSEEFEQKPWIVDIELPIAVEPAHIPEKDKESDVVLDAEKALKKTQGLGNRISKSYRKSTGSARARGLTVN